MKVLLNGLQLSKNNSGVQYYSHHLNNALKEIKNNKIETILYSFSFHRLPFFRIQRILLENLILPYYLKRNGFDLYHSTNYILPFFIKSLSVVTVHDLITFDFPELCQTESVLYFRLFLPLSVKKADKIIAVSETTKKDILNRFKIPESKIAVIHLGVSSIFRHTINIDILLKYRITKKYILFVGNIEPKKNLDRLIRAFYILKKHKKIDHKLVIVGKKAWKYKSLYLTIDELKISEEIIFTGYVPEQDLPVIYSMADLFVFPSLYEGFGIPPLEAMACEVPVLVSDKGALPEITGGKCVQVDPYDVEDISKNIYQLLTDNELRKKMVEDGKQWVKQYTWEKTADQTVKVYRSALEKTGI